MKKNNILIISTLITSSLFVGCSDKNIVLNENTKVEQSYFNSKLIVKEKEFKINLQNGISFEPSYIDEGVVYGFTYINDDKGSYQKEDNNNLLKRVLEDGTIENYKMDFKNIEEDKPPYVIQENENSEIVYKDYFTGNEKILLSGVKASKIAEGLISPIQLVENSPYAVILESSNNKIGKFEKTINIVNVNTGEKFIKNIIYENWEGTRENFLKMDEIYFYGEEEGILYSLSKDDGVIKKLTLKDGTINEDNYDIIPNQKNSTVNKYKIYTNGLETRIICTNESFYGKTIEKQLAYKVLTKEYELLYDYESKQGIIIKSVKMLPNDFMICKINEEYVLVKFDSNGIKLVDKFDFSDVASGENEIIKDIKVVSNVDGSEILIKIRIVNSNNNEQIEVKVLSTNPQELPENNSNNTFYEVYKMYEIRNKQ